MDKKLRKKINLILIGTAIILFTLAIVINSLLDFNPVYVHFVSLFLGIVSIILGIKHKDKEFIFTGILMCLYLPLFYIILK